MSATTSLSAFPGGMRAALSITFDDAWPSQLDLALPILDRNAVRSLRGYLAGAGVTPSLYEQRGEEGGH